MPTHRPERGNVPYSDNAAAPEDIWTVAEAKSRLPEVLRRASAVGPQQIGVHRPHVVVPLDQWRARTEPEPNFGAWLVENAPRGSRSSCRAARTATGRFPSPIRVSRSDPVAGQAEPSHRYARLRCTTAPTRSVSSSRELKQDAPIADEGATGVPGPSAARHRQSRSRRMRLAVALVRAAGSSRLRSRSARRGSGSELPLDFFPSKGASGPEVLALPEAPNAWLSSSVSSGRLSTRSGCPPRRGAPVLRGPRVIDFRPADSRRSRKSSLHGQPGW